MLFSGKDKVKWVFLFLILIVIVAFGSFLQSHNTKADAQTQMEYEHQSTIELTQADQSIEVSDAERIDLSLRNSDLYLSQAKDYILSGAMSYPVVIDVQDEVIHLFLDNVDISSSYGPALHVKSAGKVIITLMEGTQNSFRDTSNNAQEQATIMSESNLTVNGGGSLSVYGNCKDAIRSKDVLKLIADKIYVRAKRDGIRGNDGVYIRTNQLTVECESNGVRSTKGIVDVSGGQISVVAGKYCINAQSDVYIHQCDFTGKGVIDLINTDGVKYIEKGCVNVE